MIREEHWERYYIPIYRIRYHFPQDWLITERLKKRLIKVSAREITLNFYPSSNPQISASNIFLKDDYIAKIKQDFPPSIFTKLLLNTPLKNPHGEKSTSRTIIKEKKMETEDNNNKLLLPFPENELQEYIHSMDILKMNGEILRIQIIMDEENKEMNPYDIMRGVMTIYYGQKVTWFYHRKGDIVRKKIGELHKTNLFVDWKNRQCIYDVESKQWHYYGEFGQHFTSDEITIFCLNQRPSRQISINEEDCYIVVSDGAVFREHTKGRYILTGYNKSYNKPTPKSCQNY